MPKQSVVIIEAGKVDSGYWRELWQYRELIYFLAWRDILVRYKQTLIGVLWALIRPVLTMLVFTIIFGKLAKLPTDNIPYPLLVFSAMVPWQFFSNAFSETGNSLISNSNIISKVFFPRLVIPSSVILVSFVDFLIAAGLLSIMMVWYGVIPDWRIATLPAFVLMLAGAALGTGLWLAALSAKYRDFKYIVPFLVQFGLYLSPVGFSSSIIPEQWRLLYSFNPMTGIIDGFRWALLGTGSLTSSGLTLSASLILLILATGLRYFRQTERSLADSL